VRVGHRIIDINGQSVVAVPHEKIVSMLATAVGEVNHSCLLLLIAFNQQQIYRWVSPCLPLVL